MVPNLPVINGRRYSFASIELAIMAPRGPKEIFIDISAIDYGETLEIAKVRGTSRMPLGWTEGDYDCNDTSITMGKASLKKLIRALGPGWVGSNLVCNVKYAAPGEPLTVDTIHCRIGGASDSHASGPDSLNVTLTCPTILIERDGLHPLGV